MIAGLAATLIESFKLYRAPWLDAFRLTLAGVVLLGRLFSFYDIAVYWLAIAIAMGLDLGLRKGQHAGSPVARV